MNKSFSTRTRIKVPAGALKKAKQNLAEEQEVEKKETEALSEMAEAVEDLAFEDLEYAPTVLRNSLFAMRFLAALLIIGSVGYWFYEHKTGACEFIVQEIIGVGMGIFIWRHARFVYEFFVARFAIAKNTKAVVSAGVVVCAKLENMKDELNAIRESQVALSKILTGIRDDMFACQVHSLNEAQSTACICPYCQNKVVLPGWIKDGRGVSCPSCGERFKFCSADK